MARTNKKWMRIYIDGYDFSGYTRDAGTIGEITETVPDACLTDAIKNALTGQTEIVCGPINAVLDNDSSTYPAGLFTTLKAAGTNHIVTVAIGALAVPAIGNPMFSASMQETAFNLVEGNGFVSVNLALDKYAPGTQTAYDDAFGYVIHPSGAETAVNSANQTIDMGGYSSSLGGIFVYHLFTSVGAGTVILKMQQSANGTAGWTDVTGATSAALTTPNTSGLSGMIALAATTTVDRYLRWQLVFSGCTSATFFAGFIRQT